MRMLAVQASPPRRAAFDGPKSAEILADGIVHAVGLFGGLIAGGLLLAIALSRTAPEVAPALFVYVASILALFTASAAFNLWPDTPARAWLARVDQAAIFLFIAGSYTPFLALLAGTTAGKLFLLGVWGAALAGMAVKLTAPARLGRAAIPVYLGIGWSGLALLGLLAGKVPDLAIWLIVAGGIVYSAGVAVHLSRLRFHSAIWHGFVVIAAALHFWAVLDCLVLSRL